jgi:aspartyl-tRNA(Asn)/glutamyl-tRNA(Gln) amidotransferase subunit B
MNKPSHDLWEPVIGLEIHAQLNTKSKLFSSAPNHFGDEPNINISTVCTGQPGSLPILNKEAVHKAVQFGLAIQADISLDSTFDRKSYFYPDSPRNFQITQYENPIIRNGHITANVDGVAKTFQIDRAHLEDDSGMLKHFSHFAGIDYNRAGSPLIEIVSTPCIHSAKEAAAYAQGIRSILLYLNACDGNMDEGSLRIDVNISVRLKGKTTLRPRVEIKNMNSFSFLQMAIESETARQIALYTKNPNVPFEQLIHPGTYRWDTETKKTILMRTKETADDYRYFHEPDLPAIRLSEGYLDTIRAALPELPYARLQRYTSNLGLTPYAAEILIQEKWISDYFEQANLVCNHPRLLSNWITVEFFGRLREIGQTLQTLPIPPSSIGKLVRMIDQKQITGPIAKAVADEMILDPTLDPETIVKRNPAYQPIDDTSLLEPIIDQVLLNNAQSVTDFQNGNKRAFGFLVGQVMAATQGQASPQLVTALLQKKMIKP